MKQLSARLSHGPFRVSLDISDRNWRHACKTMPRLMGASKLLLVDGNQTQDSKEN